MLKFHPLRVEAVGRTAEDAICISLMVPPGLASAFAFHAGQYVPVRRKIGGGEQQRTYSLVTPPGGATLKIGVRIQPNGRMSSELGAALRAGDTLDVGPPAGRFRTQADPARARNYVAFAAGSGITPVLCVAADLLAREPASRFTLIYGNRSMARTMFLEETLALKNRYLGRFAAHFVMSREPQHSPLLNGRIDAAKVRDLAHAIEAIGGAQEYFVCGPGTMVEEVRTALQQINPDAPVRIERFIPAAGAVAPPAAAVPRGADPRAKVIADISVTMDGRRRTFSMTAEDSSVLEAAERAGLELPFSCRSGICATCRARMVAGSAVMTHNIALAPWELDAGFVLCCQARPTTPVLELTYDQK